MKEEKHRIITREEVMFFDTDCAGVVHNLAYLRMIETARTKLAAQLGMDMAVMAQDKQYPVLLRTEVDYLKPARLSDQLLIEGAIESVKGLRFWCAFELYREEADQAREILVRARQQLAVISLETEKARPLKLPASLLGLNLPKEV